jgi:hypothetical protein
VSEILSRFCHLETVTTRKSVTSVDVLKTSMSQHFFFYGMQSKCELTRIPKGVVGLLFAIIEKRSRRSDCRVLNWHGFPDQVLHHPHDLYQIQR